MNRAALIVNLLWLTCSLVFATAAHAAGRPPNVLLIVTDDQGWGDFGFHGNSKIKTPQLDKLASQSVELARFYVCPVCSPTRASLLTGRYHLRTGVLDTNMGRSMMAGAEVTLAEMLSPAGYRTAIFGKWHLGDNFPMRSIDQGFQESLVHRGGGIGQPADPPGNHYFDPILEHNGQPEKTRGYSSDVFTTAAIDYIAAEPGKPFFVYLAYNCPHVPLEVPERYSAPYLAASLDASTAKVYGMITNIDDNLGRLFAKLTELKLDNDTLVVFLSDNGPQGDRYNGELSEKKTSLHDGGIRTVCLIRWPGKLTGGRKIDQPTAHIDLVPTLLEACGVKMPRGAKLDGMSLWPLLTGRSKHLADRTLFIQWHRGDHAELYRGFAAIGPRYKLVQPVGGDPGLEPLAPKFELFDLLADPGEHHDVINEHPAIAARLKAEYAAWFADVMGTRGGDPAIAIGSSREDPTILTRQDWRGPKAGWNETSLGHWDLTVERAGNYDITLRMPPSNQERLARLRVWKVDLEQKLPAGAGEITFSAVDLPARRISLEAAISSDAEEIGAHYVEVRFRESTQPK